MVVFFSDLDNTLIYSYKHDIGADKVGVEIYNDRVISFMTPKSYALLKQADKRTLFVPATTRTPEQFARIDLGIVSKYALVCNGGILLENGVSNNRWYQTSLEIINGSANELDKALSLLERDKDRCFEVRFIHELFLFTKSDKPIETVERLTGELDLDVVDVFNNGIKVYVVPKNMDKGTACRRFKEWFGLDKSIAAGDSAFDVSMLMAADFAIAPKSLCDIHNIAADAVYDTQIELFSDFVLENYLEFL